MNLFEVTDEFKNTKTDPKEDLAFLDKREKAIRYQLQHVHQQRERVQKQIAGNIMRPAFGEFNYDNPEEQKAIQKILDTGYIAVTRLSNRDSGRRVDIFVPNIPQNKEIVPKLQRLIDRETALQTMQSEIPTERKRAKGRLSAWKRKQPNYVGRATGKELLAEIKKKVEDFIVSKNWGITINNAYYWAKNKMIVIDIPVRPGIDNKTSIDAAKTIVKPELTKFLDELGYTQFRVVDRYNQDTRQMLVKIQLDDVEAKNKADSDETE